MFAVAILATVTFNQNLNAQLRTPKPGITTTAPAPVPPPTPVPPTPPTPPTATPQPPAPPADTPEIEEVKADLEEAQAQVTELSGKLKVAEAALATAQGKARADGYQEGLDKANADNARENEGLKARVSDYFFGRRVLFCICLVLLLVLVYLALRKYIKSGQPRYITLIVIGAIVLYLILFPSTVGAATLQQSFACVNPATGPSVSQQYPIAVIGADNELRCTVSGITVEVKDEDGTVVPVTGTPASFKIKPTANNIGRGQIFVDGRAVSILAIADGTHGSFGNIWLDMSRQMMPKGSSVDTHARLVIEGIACPTLDAVCVTAFRAKAWGSGKGTSHAAGTEIGTRMSALNDAFTALKSAFDGHVADTTIHGGGGLDEAKVGAIVDGKITPLKGSIQLAQNTADDAKIQAGRALHLGETISKVSEDSFNKEASGKKLTKSDFKSAAQALHCAREKATTGTMPDGCVAPK